MLTQTHISKLFCNLTVGDQVIFEANWKNWIKSTEPAVINTNLPISFSRFKTQKISLMEILNTTHTGKEIKNFYNKTGKLHDEQRNLLIGTITKYIEGNGVEFSLSDCTDLEKEICTIFPTEEIVSI